MEQNEFYIDNFVTERKNSDTATRLFIFIEATPSRNWKLHLDALEDMIPDFTSMDHINYRQLSAVCIAGLKHLENNDRATWNYLNYFMEGNFLLPKE